MATNYKNTNSATHRSPQVKTTAYAGSGKHFSPAPKKPQKKSAAKILSIVAIVVGIILLIVAGVLFGREWFGSKSAAEDIKKAREAVAVSPVTQEGNPSDSQSVNAAIPVVDWDKLYKINKDIVGWLQIPGTNINYPVLQGATNDDYILKTLSGVDAVEGSIFMDSESSRKYDDRHTIIYGHNIQNGSMFHAIASYVDKGYFNEHRTIYYVTPEKNYVLKAIATYLTDGNDTNVRIFDFADDAQFKSWLETRYQSTVVKADDVKIDDIKHLFEFSTCSYSRNDGRTILMAIEDPNANAQSDPNAKPVNNSEGQFIKQN